MEWLLIIQQQQQRSIKRKQQQQSEFNSKETTTTTKQHTHIDCVAFNDPIKMFLRKSTCSFQRKLIFFPLRQIPFI
jgi:hypothetical protein